MSDWSFFSKLTCWTADMAPKLGCGSAFITGTADLDTALSKTWDPDYVLQNVSFYQIRYLRNEKTSACVIFIRVRYQLCLTEKFSVLLNRKIKKCQNRTCLNLSFWEFKCYGETWPRSPPSSTRAPETDMSRPGFEPRPHELQEGTLAKSYSSSLLITIRNIYTRPPQCAILITWIRILDLEWDECGSGSATGTTPPPPPKKLHLWRPRDK